MLADVPVAVVLPTRDLDRSREFYEERLGLTLVSGDGPLIFSAGRDTRLQVYRTDVAQPEHTQVEFRVEDIAAVIAGLSERGVVFEDYEGTVDHVMQSGQAKLAWFKDPDGNTLALLEWSGP
jgi:catechol 2,3-dioxygenase-like lactoylglutathione lyase family enzyme